MSTSFAQRLAVSRGLVAYAVIHNALQAWLGNENELIHVELASPEDDKAGIDYRIKHKYGEANFQAKTHWTLRPDKVWVETVAPNGLPGWLYSLERPDVLVMLYPRQGVGFIISVMDLNVLQGIVLQYRDHLDVKRGPRESELIGIPLELVRYLAPGKLRVINFQRLDEKLFPGPPQEDWLARV